ncbi:MAG TPA: hypothetical protein VN922_19645 [Bacteroidia bacterium]|nr:hypothetical protein [Bacteroidia bacterium]
MADAKNKYPEIRIRGVGKNTKKQIENIASHLDVKPNDFLKMKLLEIINSYPEKMKLSIDKGD